MQPNLVPLACLLLSVSLSSGLRAQFALQTHVLWQDAAMTAPGAIGSYVNQNLGHVSNPADWRSTQTIAGTRVDATLAFTLSSWGVRATVGLTGGTDANWEQFSVQWDGFVEVLRSGTRLYTRSDDSSRLWVDIDGDGQFANAELANNHWGTPQATTDGDRTPALSPGLYRFRIQYEEGGGINRLELLAESAVVRCAYLIPSNRSPQVGGVQRIQQLLLMWQGLLCDQLDRHGFPPRCLRLETEADGTTPRVHVVSIAVTDVSLQADMGALVPQAAANAGIPLWSRGQVWLLIPEAHTQQPNGAVTGGVALGSGFGTGTEGGVAMLGTPGLALAGVGAGLTNTSAYHGLTVPAIGPHALVQDVSFPWFEGSTVSSVVSSHYGAGLHEVLHALGLPHDTTNDSNFHGNVMGNGCRGFRGATHPSLFPSDACRLSVASARALSTSAFLRDCGERQAAPLVTDDVQPSVAFGSHSIVGGLLHIPCTATDDQRLASAVLVRNGDAIDSVALQGTNANFTFRTCYFTPSATNQYEVRIRDHVGNASTASQSIVLGPVVNRAPVPFAQANRQQLPVGVAFQLDASGSMDPEAGMLAFEWDFDGDLVFDTAPSPSPTISIAFGDPFPRSVRVRVTDPGGNQTASAPLPLRVLPYEQAPAVQTAGPGTPSCTGEVTLSASLSPNIATPNFGLATSRAPAQALGFLALGVSGFGSCTQVAILGQTCVLVDPIGVFLLEFVVADAAGRHLRTLPLPPDPFLIGATVHAQSLWYETAACPMTEHWASSNRIAFTLQ